MPIAWYNCSKCGTAIKKDGYPNSSGCPSGGSHLWQELAIVGDKNYQCRNCGILIQTRSSPSFQGCTGGRSHSWSQL